MQASARPSLRPKTRLELVRLTARDRIRNTIPDQRRRLIGPHPKKAGAPDAGAVLWSAWRLKLESSAGRASARPYANVSTS